jgi:hypothetical protein
MTAINESTRKKENLFIPLLVREFNSLFETLDPSYPFRLTDLAPYQVCVRKEQFDYQICFVNRFTNF